MPVVPVSLPTSHHVTATDVDRAHDLLAERYTAFTPWLYGSAEGFRFESAGVDTDVFGMDRVEHTIATRAWVEPFDSFIVLAPTAGRMSLAASDGQESVGVGATVLAGTDVPEFVGWEGLRVDVVRLAMAPTRQIAAEISGLPPEAVRFRLARPLSADHEWFWRSVVRYVGEHVLGNPEAGTHALIRGEAFRMLATTLVQTFPNSALNALADAAERGSDRAEPATLRRAVDFMEEHADQAIGVAEIAAAARVSVRALQLAFRVHRDETPLEHLRGIRMERAHRDLQEGDPGAGDSVAAIAAKWGFTNPGRFSGDYRRRFGRPPSETLRA
jgi:AraC-like DNA-binding protein